MDQEYIYEVVDTTNSEAYYQLGVFLSFEEAKEELLKASKDKESSITEFGTDGDYEEVKIKKRKIGWSDFGVPVFTVCRECRHCEDDDQYYWVVTYPEQD